MEVQARKPHHLQVVAPRLVARPPSTPDEIDDTKHDALVLLGRVVACLLIGAFVFFGTVAVLSLEPADTTVQVQR